MSKVPITPLGDYLVAVQQQAATKTASGLFLPDKAGDKPRIADVLAVGPDASAIKVGAKIVYGGYSNSDIKIEGQEYLLIKLENVYAVVN